MKPNKKNRAGGKADAKVLFGSDQSVAQPIPVGPERPGPKFYLHVTDDGGELAFEREPDRPHLAVELVKAGNGRLVEQAWTKTIKVRLGMDKDFVTPRPRGRDWKVHQWPEPETIYSSASWRRPISRDWEPLDEDHPRRGGRVWWRPFIKKGDRS